MDVCQVLHMNGGSGENSYPNNSLLQKKVMSLNKTIFEEAITNFYISKLPATFVVADLGCSSGPNTLFVVSEMIKCIENLSKKLNHESPEYQVFLNDLPGNDFNQLFMSLASFKKELRDQFASGFGPYYFQGVPGSFYGRLFPVNSIHFAHSCYCLMWLSQAPEGIENNRRNICISSRSPPNVLRAYHEQFQKDFLLFLKCRAEELVEDGSMVLTLQGRESNDPSSKEWCYMFNLLARVLDDMVLEGIIEEEKLDSFNIPFYTPSPSEVEMEILKEGSFTINRLHVSEANWNSYDGDSTLLSEAQAYNADLGDNVAKSIRAVVEPLLVSHFGDSAIDELFERYREIIAECCMSKETTALTNVTVSLTKKVQA